MLKRLVWLTVSLGFSTSLLASPFKAYFNHDISKSYMDPYRGMQRLGSDLEEVILREISRAEHSIVLAVQEIRLPRIAKALVEKYRQGVDVKIIIEKDYNYNFNDLPIVAEEDKSTMPDPEEGNQYEIDRWSELFALIDLNQDGQVSIKEMEQRDAIYILQRNKIPVKDDTFDLSMGSGLMHHKFMVVDNKRTLLSSANFTLSGIHGDLLKPESRGNANAIIVAQSVQVSRLFTEEFYLMWGDQNGSHFGIDKIFRGARQIRFATSDFKVQFSPTSDHQDWSSSTNGLIAREIHSAKESFKAALFVFSEQKLLNSLTDASLRNVDIEVLVERKFAYRYYSEVLDLLGVELLDPKCRYERGNQPWRIPLRKAGAPRLNYGDMLHHKFAIIDGKKVLFGSHNWSEAANNINDEFLVVIEDVELAGQFEKEFGQLIQSADLGLPSYIERKISEQEAQCAM